MKNVETIAVIGAGQMGEAFLSGMLKKNIVASSAVIAAEPRPERREALAKQYGITCVASNSDAVKSANIIVVAVKPQYLEAALADVKGKIPSGALLLSIVAGATIDKLTSLSGHAAIVRCMPNTPAMIGSGVTGWYASSSAPALLVEASTELLSALGAQIRVDKESALDMVTALSGSGPAYVFLFLEALIDAGVHMGLSRDQASVLASETLRGSAEYFIQSGLHPAQLKANVTSPGGTTAAGLARLEEGGLRDTVTKAVWAVYDRCREIGEGKPNRLM